MGSTKFPIVAPPQGGTPSLPVPGQPGPMGANEYTSPSLPAIVQFAFLEIDPPSGVYVTRDDSIALGAATQIPTGETFTVTVRLLTPYAVTPGQPDTPAGPTRSQPTVGPGFIQTIVESFTVGAPLVALIQSFSLAEGYLLSVCISVANAQFTGQSFARTFLNRGPFSQTVQSPAGMLAQGYITTRAPIGWPFGPFIRATDGAGFMQGYVPTPPAAGSDFSVTTNSSGRTRVQSIEATLTTSATAGNRVVSFRVITTAGAGISYRVQDSAAIAASTIVNYSVAAGGSPVRGAGAIATEQDIVLPLPSPLFDRAAITISSATQGLLAGDQWGGIRIITEEWLDAF